MDRTSFRSMFLQMMQNENLPTRNHPLVWINGDPEIGEDTDIGCFTEINAKSARVVIGRHCDIASFVSINSADSHYKTLGLSETVHRKNIVIEDHVFIGSHCAVLGGAVIGHHSVIGAGTVVRGTIPPYSLVLGNPMVVKAGYYREKFANLPPE